MNYFLHLNNDALDTGFLRRLENAADLDEIHNAGHTCLASWLEQAPNFSLWCQNAFKKDSLSHRLTLLALLDKDIATLQMEQSRRDALMSNAYQSLYDDDAVNITDALYATGTAFLYHNIAVRDHVDKMGLIREMYIPLSVNEASINYDGSSGDDFFSGDMFPFLGKLLRSQSFELEPYLGYNDQRWMCDLLKTCATLDMLYLPIESKKSLIEELYALAASNDEQTVNTDPDDVFAFKLSSDIVQYASEMGRLALLKGHPSREVMEGVAQVAKAMAEHFELSDDAVTMLMRIAQVHAGVMVPEALLHLETPLTPDDLLGVSVDWNLPANIDAQFMKSNLKLGILSSYESSLDSINWVPIYDELLKMAGIDADQFINLKGNVSLCQNIYLNDTNSDYFHRYLDTFLNSKALETTQDNGVYFISRRLRFIPLEVAQLRRLQQLELKALSRPNRINNYLIEYYRGNYRGLSMTEALGYLADYGGLNSLDALKAIEANFNDLKPYYGQLTAETKRHFLSNDLDI